VTSNSQSRPLRRWLGIGNRAEKSIPLATSKVGGGRLKEKPLLLTSNLTQRGASHRKRGGIKSGGETRRPKGRGSLWREGGEIVRVGEEKKEYNNRESGKNFRHLCVKGKYRTWLATRSQERGPIGEIFSKNSRERKSRQRRYSVRKLN